MQTQKKKTTTVPEQAIVHKPFSPAELVAKMKPATAKKMVRVRNRPHNPILLAERERLGLTLVEVSSGIAAIQELSVTAIMSAERGYDVRLSTAKTLAAFYGMTIEELWPDRG